MLSHSPTTIPEVVPQSFRTQQNELAWSAIESVLRKFGAATTKEIADAIGLSPASAIARLRELRELGEVRFGAARGRSTIRTWSLGAEDFIERAEQMMPTITKATQLGIFQRDPLVAALFGDGQARCVSCNQPQGALHGEGCVFVSINIDAIHQEVAA
ncbi:winged helix-turn-helix domain-containing protein [Rugamonas aquatica]|uniref:Winged helix-turn-helix transcriptional regulator n=1 Tax=Rugamonas aquatica TaxID=2743357 RepID=A0A6A7N1V6_9BURK|nr:winged helix-turn-helix domain-containing protein [Rugamonas aquatica]MQA39013.1 winged helix-turn-helix transcriptional regulator [Rugamonas aquatica]